MPNKCYCYIVAWVVSCPVALTAIALVVVAVSSLHIYDAIDPPPMPTPPPRFVRFSKKEKKQKQKRKNFAQL